MSRQVGNGVDHQFKRFFLPTDVLCPFGIVPELGVFD